MKTLDEKMFIEGYVIAHEGVPASLFCRQPEYLDILKANNPGQKIEKSLIKRNVLEEHSNVVLLSGKDMVLESIFTGGDCCRYVVLGDGSFSFDAAGKPTGTPTFALETDTDLNNPVAGKSFDLIENFIEVVNGGWEKHILTTFFSDQDLEIGDPWSANNSGFLINEIGLAASVSGDVYGDYLSKFILSNYPLDPTTSLAITFEWVIRVR